MQDLSTRTMITTARQMIQSLSLSSSARDQAHAELLGRLVGRIEELSRATIPNDPRRAAPPADAAPVPAGADA